MRASLQDKGWENEPFSGLHDVESTSSFIKSHLIQD